MAKEALKEAVILPIKFPQLFLVNISLFVLHRPAPCLSLSFLLLRLPHSLSPFSRLCLDGTAGCCWSLTHRLTRITRASVNHSDVFSCMVRLARASRSWPKRWPLRRSRRSSASRVQTWCPSGWVRAKSLSTTSSRWRANESLRLCSLTRLTACAGALSGVTASTASHLPKHYVGSFPEWTVVIQRTRRHRVRVGAPDQDRVLDSDGRSWCRHGRDLSAWGHKFTVGLG